MRTRNDVEDAMDTWMPLGLLVVGALLAYAGFQYRRYRARPTVRGLDGEEWPSPRM